MMLIVLDKNPITAAKLVPNNLKFKQLLELAQMLCSCGFSNLYKKYHKARQYKNGLNKTQHGQKNMPQNYFYGVKKI